MIEHFEPFLVWGIRNSLSNVMAWPRFQNRFILTKSIISCSHIRDILSYVEAFPLCRSLFNRASSFSVGPCDASVTHGHFFAAVPLLRQMFTLGVLYVGPFDTSVTCRSLLLLFLFLITGLRTRRVSFGDFFDASVTCWARFWPFPFTGTCLSFWEIFFVGLFDAPGTGWTRSWLVRRALSFVVTWSPLVSLLCASLLSWLPLQLLH